MEPWQLFVFQIASIYRNHGQSMHAMELFSYTLVLSKDLTKWSAEIEEILEHSLVYMESHREENKIAQEIAKKSDVQMD